MPVLGHGAPCRPQLQAGGARAQHLSTHGLPAWLTRGTQKPSALMVTWVSYSCPASGAQAQPSPGLPLLQGPRPGPSSDLHEDLTFHSLTPEPTTCPIPAPGLPTPARQLGPPGVSPLTPLQAPAQWGSSLPPSYFLLGGPHRHHWTCGHPCPGLFSTWALEVLGFPQPLSRQSPRPPCSRPVTLHSLLCSLNL